jgi:hypothetical protein
VVIDALAKNRLHREPQTAAFDFAAVDQLRDGRMTELRQNLPFSAELLDEAWMPPHDLERDLLVEMPVVPIGQVNRRGPATSEQSADTPVADARAGRQGRIVMSVAEKPRKQTPGQRAAGWQYAIEVWKRTNGSPAARDRPNCEHSGVDET